MPTPSVPCRTVLAAAWILTAGLSAPIRAATQSHGLAQPTAIQDVRLELPADAPRKTIVLRHGRIESVLEATAALPPGVRRIDGKGLLAVPAFVDAYTQAGCAPPPVKAERDMPASTRSDVQVDMREANRKGIAPAFRAAEAFELEADKSKAYRESGFGWLISAPAGELLSGTSVLATSRDAAPRDRIVLPHAYAHGEFRASGQGYPGTPMGYMAQLRQFFLDAGRQRELELRFGQRRAGPRPPFDPDLSAVRPILMHERRLMCAADSDLSIERWIALSDEQGFDLAIAGGRAAHELASTLAERKIPVVLTLDWGEEPKDPHAKDKDKKKDPEAKPETEGTPEKPDAEKKKKSDEQGKADEAEAKLWGYEEPLGVREEKRRRWEKDRDCAQALLAAKASFAFGSAGSTPAELLKKVRTLVEKGLPREAALQALTAAPARWLSLEDHLGVIAPGKDATFALWTDDPLAKDAQVAWMFVDGFGQEFETKPKGKDKAGEKPKAGLDPAGVWEVTTETPQGSRTSKLTLEMDEEGLVTGKLVTKNPFDESELTGDVEGRLSGSSLSIEAKLTISGGEISLRLSGELSPEGWSGDSTARGSFGEVVSPFRAVREPKR